MCVSMCFHTFNGCLYCRILALTFLSFFLPSSIHPFIVFLRTTHCYFFPAISTQLSSKSPFVYFVPQTTLLMSTKASLEPSNREYADAAADTKRQYSHASQPPPQQQQPQGYGQQQQRGGGGGGGRAGEGGAGGGAMNLFADGMAWCMANQQMLFQGAIALFAVW